MNHPLWGKAVLLDAYCDVCLCMLHIAIYVCTYIGCILPVDNSFYIYIIGFNALLNDLNSTRIAIISAIYVLLIWH